MYRRSTAYGGEDEVGRMARAAYVDAKVNQWKWYQRKQEAHWCWPSFTSIKGGPDACFW